MKDKIVLLFGSFNPVTKAHLETLTTSMDLVGATKGIFIPTSYKELYSKMVKTNGRMALSNELRVKMLNSVCENDKRLNVCTYEIDNDITSNTLKTIEYLITLYPDAELYYTCGADKLKSFVKWKNIESIFNNVEVIIFNRSDIDVYKFILNDEILSKFKNKFHIMDNLFETSISSTKIRNLFFSDNDEYKKLLPASVAQIFSTLNKDDYPLLDLSTWIKLMHKHGGMHGNETSLKELYKVNKEILKNYLDTKTYFYNSNDLLDLNNYNFNYKTSVKVLNSFPITTYNDLINNDLNPVIINVCNKERACGNYDKGTFSSLTDEEELCRISSLSNFLYPYGNPKLKSVKECNIPFKEQLYPIKNDTVIYCKDVVSFRDNKLNWYKELNNLIKFDLILIPALSFREKESKLLKEDLKYLNSNKMMNESGKKLFKNLIINAFNTALLNNKDSLILTDLGIRSYYLNEIDVLNILKEVIDDYNGKFKEIVITLPVVRKNYYLNFYKEFCK